MWSLIASYNILKGRPRVVALLASSLTAIAKTLGFLAFNQQKTSLVNALTPNRCDELSLYLGKIWVMNTSVTTPLLPSSTSRWLMSGNRSVLIGTRAPWPTAKS